MAMNANYLDAIADHGGSLVTHVSLADGPLEGDELTGIDGRQSISWDLASDGDISASNEPVFEVDGGETVNHVQYWSASTGGTYYGSSSVTEETFAGSGTYTITAADINHNAA